MSGVTHDTAMPDPHVIYQDFLDVTSFGILNGDPEPFIAGVALPLIVRTDADVTILESEEDLRNDTIALIQALKSQQVTHYIRLVKKARYLDEDVIEGWHATYALHNARSVIPQYNSRMVMRRVGKEWRVTEADHELTGRRLPITLLRAAPGCFEAQWAKDKADIIATQARAEPLYQAFIDSMSDAVHDGDFDEWCAHYTFPHEIHYDATDHLAKTPDDVVAFFDLMRQNMKNLGADCMIRTARYAEFLSDDRIFGYHNTVLVSGNRVVFGPVKSRMMLTLEDGRWKCSSVTNSLAQTTPSDAEYTTSATLPTMREIQERTRK